MSQQLDQRLIDDAALNGLLALALTVGGNPEMVLAATLVMIDKLEAAAGIGDLLIHFRRMRATAQDDWNREAKAIARITEDAMKPDEKD